ncbi:MAG TPA: hypothetical protein VIJ28_07060 [Chloroflexota bacterium]|jgi:hypothetical protein
MAIRIILGTVVVVALLAMTGVLSFLSPVPQGIYLAAYGRPMPHRDGSAIQQINDWLFFLPNDPTTRGLIVCAAILGLLVIWFCGGLIAMRITRLGRARKARADARLRAVNAYNITKQ